MSEQNIIEVVVVPEVPKVVPNEEIYVYIPEAANDTKGIASFDSRSINVVAGRASVKDTYVNGLIDVKIQKLAKALEITENKDEYTFILKALDDSVLSSYTLKVSLDSPIVGARYDEYKQVIIFTLQNGDEISVPVDDITSDLATTSQLEAAITSEATERNSADVQLQQSIDNEIATRMSENNALSGRISEEVSNRSNADLELQNQINNKAPKKERYFFENVKGKKFELNRRNMLITCTLAAPITLKWSSKTVTISNPINIFIAGQNYDCTYVAFSSGGTVESEVVTNTDGFMEIVTNAEYGKIEIFE